MAESEKLESSSFSEQFRLVDLNLPTFTDENIKRQVQQTHRKGYVPVLRQPHINSISQILKPATDFVDSFLLAKKVPENEIELLTSNLLEFDSTFAEIMALGKNDCYGLLTLEILILFKGFAFIYPQYFCITAMDETANKVVQMFEEINIYNVSMKILGSLWYLSWDAKAIVFMGWFVFKFLEFLGFLLHGPNQQLIELASSMAALKENPLSILGSSLEKFQLPLNQLNSLIKMTLEVIKYIYELTLLSDTQYITEDLFSTSVHSAVLSLVACYIQITLLMQNGEVALELSHLIFSLGYILNDIKHQYINCKPHMEEMEAHMQSNALFEDILKTRIEISELVKSFTYSKDGHQSVIDGSTMSKVDLEVLKEKGILFFISNLDISFQEDFKTTRNLQENKKRRLL
ncbi:uncharacterized protein LOC127804531 [Diospyros lotus]|uniref:uncharacterized protein LOC127804531 n=1 Tax=Diospyros lotus TaxID=55363 RepID=UPI00224E1EE7|nr:uncharacterized protein LOC127804531 [Diospyros lotus]